MCLTGAERHFDLPAGRNVAVMAEDERLPPVFDERGTDAHDNRGAVGPALVRFENGSARPCVELLHPGLALRHVGAERLHAQPDELVQPEPVESRRARVGLDDLFRRRVQDEDSVVGSCEKASVAILALPEPFEEMAAGEHTHE